ncbi:hypothetical protein AUCHE_05_04590 [Austwickia chelonae NBRC 105200]|uniref:Uncharacterized protein n=1 Tax=Austwickia chelonae NBRC 105200 TaxID=1184607 RepID=K6W6V0_9MICO|nr:hypothetical protein AUCHE_05_04590 [Austwickia chelonae NBRC 105200]
MGVGVAVGLLEAISGGGVIMLAGMQPARLRLAVIIATAETIERRTVVSLSEIIERLLSGQKQDSIHASFPIAYSAAVEPNSLNRRVGRFAPLLVGEFSIVDRMGMGWQASLAHDLFAGLLPGRYWLKIDAPPIPVAPFSFSAPVSGFECCLIPSRERADGSVVSGDETGAALLDSGSRETRGGAAGTDLDDVDLVPLLPVDTEGVVLIRHHDIESPFSGAPNRLYGCRSRNGDVKLPREVIVVSCLISVAFPDFGSEVHRRPSCDEPGSPVRNLAGPRRGCRTEAEAAHSPTINAVWTPVLLRERPSNQIVIDLHRITQIGCADSISHRRHLECMR